MAQYQTIEQEKYDLETLTDKEQLFFEIMYRDSQKNLSRPQFQQQWEKRVWELAGEYQVMNHGRTIDAPIYKIYDDLSDRIGIRTNDSLAPKVQGILSDPIIAD